MKICILGTRGIPNNHGGFEQFAEYLSVGLVKMGHDVSVYNSHNHPFQNSFFKGVNIIHQFDPENKLGTAGQFLYDLNCILDTRKRNFDLILQLGYTSSSIWYWLLPKNSCIVTNMDGLEWKRSKYSGLVRNFLKYAERWAALNSDHLIADSVGIQKYLYKKYKRAATFIPYGAHLFCKPEESVVKNLGLKPYTYDMLIARLEPENNIETILEGFSESRVNRKFIVVGNYFTEYGQYIRNKFIDDRICFLGKVFNIDILNNLRHFSNLYFHGHSVGGTNPSLLEAMASNAFICAHDNIFNKAILGRDGLYFRDSHQVCDLVNDFKKSEYEHFLLHNREKISIQYNWDRIIKTTEIFLRETLSENVISHVTEEQSKIEAELISSKQSVLLVE